MRYSTINRFTAFLTLLALFSPIFAVRLYAEQPSRIAKHSGLSDNQKILHVLNRLGFGTKPGDVERVKAIGLKKFIDLQLNPGRLENQTLDAKLRNFEILDMPTSEIFAKYPNPGALIRMLEGNGRNDRRNQNNPNNQNQMMMSDEQSEQMQQEDRRERRRKILEIYQKYDLKPANQIMMQVQSSRILRAVYSERQLEEVMVDFWLNHFNVYSGKGATRWFIPSYERDVIRKNALGNFKDLVVGTAKHPAMLFYLDNFQSVADNTKQNETQQKRAQRLLNNPKTKQRLIERLRQQGLSDEQINQRIKQAQNGGNQRNQRGINENYARELMELHTLGVDGGYTQEDIKEVAKAFTGWTIFDSRGYRKIAGNSIKGTEDRQVERQARQLGISPNTESGTFVFVNRLHDNSAKMVLGKKIKSGGMQDGLDVIDILVSNPSTAKFIAKKLAVRFVNDNPSEAMVDRVANVFQSSNGDIRTTLRALFEDPEFFAEENYRAKIKTPFELLVSSLRVLGAQTNGSTGLIGMLERMGEPLYGYQAPTGYPDTAGDWVNTGALLERMNFAVALASNRIPQTNVNLKPFEAASNSKILENSISRILNDEISAATKSMLVRQLDEPLPETRLDDDDSMIDDEIDTDQMPRPQRGARNRRNALREPTGNPEVFKVVGLILGSPEFQRQ